MFYILVYIFVLCFSSVFCHVHDCATPDNKEGLCVNLSDCPKLQPLFDNITTETYSFLVRSQCGYAGNEPEVCCPKTSGGHKTFKAPTQLPRRKHVELGNRFGPQKKGLPSPGECGMEVFDNRIFGGIVTGIDEFPWMALLQYGSREYEDYDEEVNEAIENRGFACGGALIHRRYVLTAAHCATGASEKALGGLQSVRLGEHNIDSDPDCDPINAADCADSPVDIKVERVIVHPAYRTGTADEYNDISLLRLSRDAPLSDFITPVCLSASKEGGLFNVGKLHFIAGWGLTEQKTNSIVKLKVKVPIAPQPQCAKTYSNRFQIRLKDSQVCAGGVGGKDSCRGDSGGPMMIPAKIPNIGVVWFMTGVVSFGPTPCATPNVPGVYTKIADYYDWIVANIQ